MQQDRTCKVPPPRPAGRKPGALGRYRGVDKAIRKIQSELRKAKSSALDAQLLKTSLQLSDDNRRLLDLLSSNADLSAAHDADNDDSEAPDASSQGLLPASSPMQTYGRAMTVTGTSTENSPQQAGESISNPLGLLADACGERRAAQQTVSIVCPMTSEDPSIHLPNSPITTQNSHHRAQRLLSRPGYISIGISINRRHLENGLEALLDSEPRECRYPEYFRSSAASPERDTGPDLDPVDQGLVTIEDAEYLFPLFFSRLHPVNGILDPVLHTPEYVRSRSALLFTWLMAISAQFDSGSGALAKRLRIHGERLSHHVHASGLKSVEIVQGYYISLLSANPASTLAAERSWLYTTYAFGMAGEMNLDARPRPGSSFEALSGTSGGEHNANAAISDHTTMNRQSNYDEIDPLHTDTYAERLSRNGERTWLRILLWERAHSAARGKVSAFPETELTQNIDSWHLHPLAISTDKYTCAFVLLRRHLAVLHTDMKRHLEYPHLSKHWARELLDSTLQPWCMEWLSPTAASTNLTERISRTFLRYVYMHGRLATLSYALSCQSTRDHNLSGIREDCFQAAVTCCEVAVQDLQDIGEPLFCMLAPTWAMISYAAVLALRLFPMLYGEQPESTVELLALLGQVALQLERAGTNPPHRFGLAALLGQHLFVLLRSHSKALAGEASGNLQSLSSAPLDAHFQGTIVQPAQPQIPEQFMTTYDPFLTGPMMPCGENTMADEFSETIWQWCGQGFSAWPTS